MPNKKSIKKEENDLANKLPTKPVKTKYKLIKYSEL